MKNPEMEIVKFHSEDVIATSTRWSGPLGMMQWSVGGDGEVHVPSGNADNISYWMNNSEWNYYNPDGSRRTTPSGKYSDSNTLDGVTINSTSYTLPLNTKLHYDINSYVGGWNGKTEGFSNKVYSVWQTCGGSSCDICNSIQHQ